ncbi:hypothetical protein ACG0Z6_10940 [Roseateles sp. BYS180W]|uniref:Uncharacterized protein n=1 Tax=Roseateles rivi TaxID=3299028 RepID=A0ABW7FWW4_9BURK
MRRWIWMISSLALVADMAQGAVLQGLWGAPGAQFRADAQGAVLETSCASAKVQGGLTLDAQGQFVATALQEPGPLMDSETMAQRDEGPRAAAAAQPVQIRGTVQGAELTLQVQAPGAARPDVYRLRRDAPTKLLRCM